MEGISSRQGGHQVAQKLTKTTCPRAPAREKRDPSSAASSIGGAGGAGTLRRAGAGPPMAASYTTAPLAASRRAVRDSAWMRGLMGSFAVLPLSDLVELLVRRRMTGSLTCERGTVRKTVHLREGSAVGAAPNDPREYLGQLLINFGHLDEAQLTKAFRTQEETKIRLGKGLTLGGSVPAEAGREVL